MDKTPAKAEPKETLTLEEQLDRAAARVNERKEGDEPVLAPDDRIVKGVLKVLAPCEVPEFMYIKPLSAVVPKCSSQKEGRARIMASLGRSAASVVRKICTIRSSMTGSAAPAVTLAAGAPLREPPQQSQLPQRSACSPKYFSKYTRRQPSAWA